LYIVAIKKKCIFVQSNNEFNTQKMQSSIFEILGYTKEYFIKNKLIGNIVVQEPDRKVYGYEGKVKEVLQDDIVLKNQKVIKKGTEVTTEIMPICGRANIKFFGSKENKLV
jgi:hypothetical protein